MPDTLRELKEYSCEVLVHDPYWDPVEAKAECEVELMKELNEIAPVSAIVVAVIQTSFKDKFYGIRSCPQFSQQLQILS